MRYRTTVEQGLTPMQVFKEMYYDLIEHYDKKVYHGMMEYLFDKKETFNEQLDGCRRKTSLGGLNLFQSRIKQLAE
jgi:hypothetical protein